MTPDLSAVFQPRSIAVIGASREEDSIGNTILWNLVRHGFHGAVFPVNPKADVVRSIKCWPDVRAVPDPVDLAIVAVPARAVPGVVEGCLEKGVRAICVISAGFRETGEAGARVEREIAAACRARGVRLLGPNCMGVVNTDPAIRMDATFARTFPRPGGIAFLSQSGAMGVTILDHAEDLALGLREFASLGNKADLSGNDLLEWWGADERTTVVLMYLESFGNPRRFVPIARKVTRGKPVVCVKAGRTDEGGRAARSHTGALAGADVAVDALLEQAGVLRVGSVGEMFDVAQALSTQPLPRGPRVAILSNAGGPAILATDFLVAKGLSLAPLSESTKAALARLLPAEASVGNPVDMVASAGAREYGAALPLLLADDAVDLVLTIFVPPVTLDPVGVARAIFQASKGTAKPVLGCFMARRRIVDEIKRLESAWFPLYDYPEDAVQAAWNLVRVRALRDDDLGEPEPVARDRDAVARLVDAAARRGGGWLPAADAVAAIRAYGIPAPPLAVARDAADAAAVAARVGFPVALKLDGEAFLHKTDVGGVALGLADAAAVAAAARRLAEAAARAAPGAPYRLVVQRMAAPGVELIMGSRTDPTFGPLLAVGLGGVHVEVWKDVRFGLVPLTRPLAGRLLSRLRGRALLDGVRGGKPVDLRAVEDVLLRLSRLVEDFPAVAEIEMNPVIARPDGVEAVDVRVRVEAPAAPREAAVPAGAEAAR